jgi:GntR family transcriptional regulator/MocR family aminotransferase
MNLLISIDDKSSVPIYQQLVDGLGEMIARGDLPPGTQLPSSRDLARLLNVSRATTSRAYEELMRQKVVESRPAVGSFVAADTLLAATEPEDERPPLHRPMPAVVHDHLSDYAVRVLSTPGKRESLTPAAPALDFLPYAKWQEVMTKVIRQRKRVQDGQDNPVFGSPSLKEVIADYLRRNRGIRSTAGQVIILPDSETSLDLIARLFINNDDLVAVESPGFAGARRVFAAHGANILPVPVDGEGIIVSALEKSNIRPKLIYTTPSHHDPTGAVLSAERRAQLLDFAQEWGSLIVEDDYNCEFQYGRPVKALQATDPHGCVIYMSSFRKILFPLVQRGVVVIPMHLVPIFERARALVELDFHSLEHEALAEFVQQGHLERHIRQTRKVYAIRRQALVTSLLRHLNGKAKIATAGAGTHILVRFGSEAGSDKQILACAEAAALPMISTSSYYVYRASAGEFLIPFTHVDESTVSSSVEMFSGLLFNQQPGSLPPLVGAMP